MPNGYKNAICNLPSFVSLSVTLSQIKLFQLQQNNKTTKFLKDKTMKRNQLMAVFALSIVLTGVGISKNAVAESNINPIQVIAQRICAPAPFGEIRNLEIK
jgi:mevalonate pyrophosphate decarboxylase